MKRFLALLIALSMLLTMFASCGKKEELDGETGAEGEEAEQAEQAQKEEYFTKEFSVNENTTVKLVFKGADSYLLTAELYVNGESETPVDIREATSAVLGHEDGIYSENKEWELREADLNFDGNTDLLIEAWQDPEGNEPYFCFLWNDGKSEFEYSFQINSPVLDTANRRIYSTVYEDGNEYAYIYRLYENELIRDISFSLSDSVEFATDISAYEEFMAPADRDGFLMLLNKEHSVGADYVPENMIDVVNTRKDGRNTQQMVYTAAKALEALYIEMYAAGYTDVSVTSAYRSYDYQGTLFNNYVNNEMSKGATREEAEKQANTYSALPGTSEHQAGLCCDMHNLGAASQAFENQDAYLWLCENAWKFGFILRYPKNKEDVTGYMFEPWHYRFVGRYHAEKIYNYGVCLEEYLEIMDVE